MKSPKFDEQDRRNVISEVERHFNTRLSQVGSRRKFLEDAKGKSYWILGGYEDWHGIPPDMFEEENHRKSNGVLVIAKRYQTRIDIYSGPLQVLINNKHALSHTQKGDYQFNIQVKGNHLYIKEISGNYLTLLGNAPYLKEEKGTFKQVKEIRSFIDKLTAEERVKLLRELEKNS